MNKRLLDGGAMWTSQKIASLNPPWVKPEYPWLYCLAESNGVFEIDHRVIWARCYAAGRPEIDVDKVALILQAFQVAKLLFVWEQNRKTWGFWTNSDLPGRLPRKSWQERDRKSGKFPPDPPQDALRTFLHESARKKRAGACKSVSAFASASASASASGHVSGAHPSDSLAQVKRPSPYAFQGIQLRITEREHRGFVAAFSSLNLEQEYREMDSWLVANPKRPKKNHGRFAGGWLKRSYTKQQESEQREEREMVKARID